MHVQYPNNNPLHLGDTTTTLSCRLTYHMEVLLELFWGIASSCLAAFSWIASYFFQIGFHFRKEEHIAMGEIWGLWWTSDAGNAPVSKTAAEAIVADETSVV